MRVKPDSEAVQRLVPLLNWPEWKVFALAAFVLVVALIARVTATGRRFDFNIGASIATAVLAMYAAYDLGYVSVFAANPPPTPLRAVWFVILAASLFMGAFYLLWDRVWSAPPDTK